MPDNPKKYETRLSDTAAQSLFRDLENLLSELKSRQQELAEVSADRQHSHHREVSSGRCRQDRPCENCRIKARFAGMSAAEFRTLAVEDDSEVGEYETITLRITLRKPKPPAEEKKP